MTREGHTIEESSWKGEMGREGLVYINEWKEGSGGGGGG